MIEAGRKFEEKIKFTKNIFDQMLEYEKKYSFLSLKK